MDGNGYVCLKALTLSGADYLPGNRIPADAVLPNRVRALEKMGYIAECDAEEQVGYLADEAPEAVFMVPISPVSGDGEHLDGIPATEADVAAMALVLMLTAENASEAIREMENETALRLVQALDSRKSVKGAAAARIKALHPEEAESGVTVENTGGGDAE